MTRIAHEIIEKNKGTKDVIIVGIRKRGVPLAERLSSIIENIEGVHIPIGVLDITLYRDDLAHMSYQPLIQETHIDEDITNKTLVLLDDVLYTGRTIRAALDALIDLGVVAGRAGDDTPCLFFFCQLGHHVIGTGSKLS